MAAPLSGVGQQQQVPLAQSFQPGGGDASREIRQKEQAPRENEIQSRDAATNQSQETKAPQQELSALSSRSEGAESKQRGSYVDLVV